MSRSLGINLAQDDIPIAYPSREGSQILYRWALEKREGCGVVAHLRLSEPRVTIKWLLAKRNILSDLPASLDSYGI